MADKKRREPSLRERTLVLRLPDVVQFSSCYNYANDVTMMNDLLGRWELADVVIVSGRVFVVLDLVWNGDGIEPVPEMWEDRVRPVTDKEWERVGPVLETPGWGWEPVKPESFMEVG